MKATGTGRSPRVPLPAPSPPPKPSRVTPSHRVPAAPAPGASGRGVPAIPGSWDFLPSPPGSAPAAGDNRESFLMATGDSSPSEKIPAHQKCRRGCDAAITAGSAAAGIINTRRERGLRQEEFIRAAGTRERPPAAGKSLQEPVAAGWILARLRLRPCSGEIPPRDLTCLRLRSANWPGKGKIREPGWSWCLPAAPSRTPTAPGCRDNGAGVTGRQGNGIPLPDPWIWGGFTEGDSGPAAPHRPLQLLAIHGDGRKRRRRKEITPRFPNPDHLPSLLCIN